MLLRDYIKANAGSGLHIAAVLEVSASYLSQMTTGHRPVPAGAAPAIESATGFVVRRWDLRPADWHRIWPELIGSDGAPPVTADVREVA